VTLATDASGSLSGSPCSGILQIDDGIPLSSSCQAILILQNRPPLSTCTTTYELYLGVGPKDVTTTGSVVGVGEACSNSDFPQESYTLLGDVSSLVPEALQATYIAFIESVGNLCQGVRATLTTPVVLEGVTTPGWPDGAAATMTPGPSFHPGVLAVTSSLPGIPSTYTLSSNTIIDLKSCAVALVGAAFDFEQNSVQTAIVSLTKTIVPGGPSDTALPSATSSASTVAGYSRWTTITPAPLSTALSINPSAESQSVFSCEMYTEDVLIEYFLPITSSCEVRLFLPQEPTTTTCITTYEEHYTVGPNNATITGSSTPVGEACSLLDVVGTPGNYTTQTDSLSIYYTYLGDVSNAPSHVILQASSLEILESIGKLCSTTAYNLTSLVYLPGVTTPQEESLTVTETYIAEESFTSLARSLHYGILPVSTPLPGVPSTFTVENDTVIDLRSCAVALIGNRIPSGPGVKVAVYSLTNTIISTAEGASVSAAQASTAVPSSTAMPPTGPKTTATASPTASSKSSGSTASIATAPTSSSGESPNLPPTTKTAVTIDTSSKSIIPPSSSASHAGNTVAAVSSGAATTPVKSVVTTTISGQTNSAHSTGVVIVETKTSSAGGSAETIFGTVIATQPFISAPGSIVTQSRSGLGTAASVESVFTTKFGGQFVSADSSGAVIGGTATLTAGGSAITVAGTVISVGSSGIVIGDSTVQVVPPASGMFTTVVGGQSISADSTEVVIGGTETLSAGGPGATISGTVISVGASGIIIGSSTEPFSDFTATNQGSSTGSKKGGEPTSSAGTNSASPSVVFTGGTSAMRLRRRDSPSEMWIIMMILGFTVFLQRMCI
jgi:hypothetical protein